MEDKYGYVRLKNTLEEIAEKLKEEKQDDLANDVLRASKFYGGMPSEFMGESGLALKSVLKNKKELSKETVKITENIYNEIVEGFEKVGHKFPK